MGASKRVLRSLRTDLNHLLISEPGVASRNSTRRTLPDAASRDNSKDTHITEERERDREKKREGKRDDGREDNKPSRTVINQ